MTRLVGWGHGLLQSLFLSKQKFFSFISADWNVKYEVGGEAAQILNGKITPFPMERLREQTIFNEIRSFIVFAEKHRVSYAVFGGLGTAAYLGHLPFRLIKDLDLIVAPNQVAIVEKYFREAGFRVMPTAMSEKANFRRFTKRTPSLEVMVQIFPGIFTFLDLNDPSLEPKWKYDFDSALQLGTVHRVYNLDNTSHLDVRSVPLEDLVISKIWPFFESNMFYDLCLLLPLLEDSQLFNERYYQLRLETSNPIMKMECSMNARTFIRTLQQVPELTRLLDNDVKQNALGFFNRITNEDTGCNDSELSIR